MVEKLPKRFRSKNELDIGSYLVKDEECPPKKYGKNWKYAFKDTTLTFEDWGIDPSSVIASASLIKAND